MLFCLLVVFLFDNFFDIFFLILVVVFFYCAESLTQASLGFVKLEKVGKVPPAKINDDDRNDEQHIEVAVRNYHPEELKKGVSGAIREHIVYLNVSGTDNAVVDCYINYMYERVSDECY